MAGSFDGRVPTRGVEQVRHCCSLKKGAHLLKCGKRGKPKFCPFRLSSDEKTLVWYSKDREKHLSVNSVSTVILGQKTTNFYRQRWPEKEHQSLSLVYRNGECSLDLICRDRDQAECWHLGLTALISGPSSPFSSVGSKSSRQMTSCTSTPRSYIQRKSKLSAVHDTPRHKQVYPSYGSPRMTQKDLFGGYLDCSEALFYQRQRTFSDVDSYLERLSPKVANPVRHSLKDILVANNKHKTQTISRTPKVKAFEGPRAACRLDSLKDVFLWGDVVGSTLDSEDIPKALPRLVGSTKMLDVQSIACGENHAAIITKQGEVFSWGKESSGRLGHKVNGSAPCPKMVESLASVHVKAVAFGSKHTCAVTVSGELFEWGHSLGLLNNNWHGRNQWLPHKLFGPMDNISVSKIACGEWHTAIITSSGQLFTYGDGTFGVLGHGDTQGIARPKEVESLKGLRVKSVACGPWHTAAIVEGMSSVKCNAPIGNLFTWGDADKGKLGHADKKMKLVPTCVDSLISHDFLQVSCGMALTVVLTSNGVVFTIGSSKHGQLGNPQADGESVCTVGGILKNEFVTEISSGSSHVAALTMNGKVFTWGKGADGQLGLGDYANRSSPTLVEALEGRQVQSIACGSNFSAAICLHKGISVKDQPICSRCQMVFNFTRKKHNCYNCGSMFCNSCSSNKTANAALAPDRNRRYRVCDACFCQLEKVLYSGEVKPQPKISKGEMFKAEIMAYTPKLSRLFKEANLIVEKMASVQGPNQRNMDSAVPIQVKTQRWGQVECPTKFISAQDNFRHQLVPNNQMSGVSFSQRMHDAVGLKAGNPLRQSTDSQRDEMSMMERILTEEVKQLRSQVTALAEQCQQKDLIVKVYKQRLDETWLIVRDEAAKCKAAKDVIKVLTNQCNALSAKLSVGQQPENSKMTRNSVAEQAPSPGAAVPADGSFSHRNIARTFDRDGYTTEADSVDAPVDGVIEQIERGVYVTLAVSPGGRKDIRRIRFSRKHFGEKAAQCWWEENKSRVYANYSVEQAATPHLNRA
ncbi:PH, RCC1 and FYVE domains-containing protein 1 isoform X2 [Triticum aestivum]|uniref:PH, RCC1 and FYVE domains-containing protein 1 isoform X2 n=1 Tax=Triticum aestivum TaxID=4565 RepID=UPI001D024E7B|nr:PH, RCC1 and FYVE domains-containing protein 1-like isoform X2 [Triticum aestivum]